MFAIASPTESICLGLTINHGGVIWRVKATNENTAAATKRALISVSNLGRFVKCLSRFFDLFVFISVEKAFYGSVAVSPSNQKSHRLAVERDEVIGLSRILSIVLPDF